KDYGNSLPNQILKEKKSELRQFLNRSLINRSKTFILDQRSVKEINEDYELAKSLEFICYLKEEEIYLVELQKFLQTTFNENPDILDRQEKQIATNFRRVVKIYDFLTYKK